MTVNEKIDYISKTLGYLLDTEIECVTENFFGGETQYKFPVNSEYSITVTDRQLNSIDKKFLIIRTYEVADQLKERIKYIHESKKS